MYRILSQNENECSKNDEDVNIRRAIGTNNKFFFYICYEIYKIFSRRWSFGIQKMEATSRGGNFGVARICQYLRNES